MLLSRLRSMVLLVSVAANTGAAALVTWERRLLANKTILTLNWSVADLLFVSMIPLIVAMRWTESWMLGFTACHTVLFVICMSGSVTITTLASISVERVQAILPMQTATTLIPRMVTATLIFIWAFSALTALPQSLFFTVVEVDFPEQEICTLKWPDSFTTLCFLLPGLYCGQLQQNIAGGSIVVFNWQQCREVLEGNTERVAAI